ncbi:putative [histone H3]-lysine(4) N-trimethyltransferase [Helianthus annuus]|nr:putative [histone H3]-lysine(4) N-trimethyltransferase [Helianthus annuus]
MDDFTSWVCRTCQTPERCGICKQVHVSCTQCCKYATYFHAMCASCASYGVELHSSKKGGTYQSKWSTYCAMHRTPAENVIFLHL